MLDVMREAATGDDVYGEDPSVNALEAYAAELTGKEAALFGISGTQTNLLALLSHCQRGHEYIVGDTAHTYMFEGGGAAVLGGIQPCPLPFNERGELELDQVASKIKPDDIHYAISRVLCLENTQAGKVLSLDYLASFSELAKQHQLKRHLDGARVFNAAVKLGVPVATICDSFDSISICLSKGLGAPVGSVLVGPEPFIKKARRTRKMLGGGTRQAGVLAACGLYALEHNVERLTEDHAHAKYLAEGLAAIDGISVQYATNMVFMRMDEALIKPLAEYLAQRNILVAPQTPEVRLVTHLDTSRDDIDTVVKAVTDYFHS